MNSGWGTSSGIEGLRTHLTATEVQVQITEVAVEGEALEQRPVGGRPAGPLLLLAPSLWFPLGRSPNPAPTRPEGLQGQLCGRQVDVAQCVGAAEELLEGWWGLPALPAETPGVSKGEGHPSLAPSLPAPLMLPPVRAAVTRQVEVG